MTTKKSPLWMRLVIWTGISFFALIVLPIALGFFMPVRYEGRATVELDRGVEVVWEALQDVEALPVTGKMMKSVSLLEPNEGRPVWEEDMGNGEVITVRTTEFDPPSRMVREMSSGSINMGGRWEYELEPAGKGCRLTIAGRTDIESDGLVAPIFRVMMILGGGVDAGLNIHIDMLAESLGTEARRAD